MNERIWSAEQTAILDYFHSGKGNLVVRARAGTGKTTTIIEGTTRAPEKAICCFAFNTKIKDELAGRIVNPYASASTLHAAGFGCVRRFWTGVRVGKNNDRADALTEFVCGSTAPDTVKRLVSKLHTKGREINPHARNIGDLTDLLYRFECEPDETWDGSKYDAEYVECRALEAMDRAATIKPLDTGIDFSDMIYLPVRNHWMNKVYDLVVVDEAQDMTTAQLEIAMGVCKGRIVVVGDDRQAVYGFRGADSDSLDRLKNVLKAHELGLKTTYRCGTEIVNLAASLVPDFVAGPNNPTGEVIYLPLDKLVETVQPGDFVLSRTNAPLVSTAMGLLRQQKRARIAGRDIGTGLKALVRKLAKGAAANSVPAFIERVGIWEQREANRMLRAKREAQVELVHDKAEILFTIAADAKSVRDIEARIDGLFTDDGLGQAGVITCSSVHRSKGLEANRVFVLASTLYPRGHNREEENIEYVAITRAKKSLFMVFDPNQTGSYGNQVLNGTSNH